MSDRPWESPGTAAPGLDTMLQEAAFGARQQTVVPSFHLVEGAARSRRTARAAASGLLAAAVVVSLGAATLAAREDRSHRSPAAASAQTLDPSLRRYQTSIPILTWTPETGRAVTAVNRTGKFSNAVRSALGSGDHDAFDVANLRDVFPDAPVGGPAWIIYRSTTKAQLDQAAANLRTIDGVQDATVIEITGLWFTISAVGPADDALTPAEKVQAARERAVELTREAARRRSLSDEPDNPVESSTSSLAAGVALFPITRLATGGEVDALGRRHDTARTTYVGPAITVAQFDLMRQRVARIVSVDISQVIGTAESAVPRPAPSRS